MRRLAIFFALSLLPACRPATIALPRAMATDVVAPGYIALGEPRRIPIAPDDEHVYQLRLEPGTFVTLVAAQDDVDVQIRVRRPGGRPFGVYTTRERYFAPDVAYFIADERGTWRFEIVVGPVRPRPGAYTLKLEAVRHATPEDRQLMTWQEEWGAQVNDLFGAVGRGDWEAAIPVFYQWLADTAKFPPRDPKHTDVMVGAITLARERWNRFQDDEEAVSMLEAAIDHVARVRGEGDVLEAPVRAWLSGMYLVQDRYADARREFETAQEVLSLQPGIEPMDQAVVLQAAGRYYLDRGPYEDAVGPLETAHALWSDGLSPTPGTLNQASYDLGSAYLFTNDLERARTMLEAATSDSALRSLPPYARVDRLTRMARTCLESADYECVRSVVDRAIRVSDNDDVSVTRVSTVLEIDAEARIGQGDYDGAARSLERALENETRRAEDAANRLLPRSRMLSTLADLEIARGRFGEADRLYREAVEAALTVPGYGPFAAVRGWSRLLRDAGRVDDAVRVEEWLGGQEQPFPFPEPEDFSEPAWTTPGRNTIVTRMERPFARNLAPLWEDLGLDAWDVPAPDCRDCLWEMHEVDPDDAGAGVLVRLIAFGDNPAAPAMRLFLFRRPRTGGSEGWEATDVIDFARNPGNRFRIEHTGMGSVIHMGADDGPGGTDGAMRQLRVVDGRFVPMDE